ncbi:SWIM zinc finger domain-containing protein [Phytophthora infestans]|uniref:SWIM zinc finger domain-containing protein n=1 Tax=Phytophthora infestans TaxID=4787 RepID=A0A833THA6_PHYIN|nr:SWIM zinc finger domain-containing protein [Phytophthora infestans]
MQHVVFECGSFKHSLTGNLGEEESIETAEVQFLFLQQVIIQAARSALRCTCKNYMHTGWICAHVIASLDLLEKIKIGLAMAAIPRRGLPGRPRAIVGALQRESDMYDVDRLIELFKKNPDCRLSETEGVYIWSVAFIHGDSLEYQVEELAHAIRRAYAHGTQ